MSIRVGNDPNVWLDDPRLLMTALELFEIIDREERDGEPEMAGSAILKVDVITDAKKALAGLDSIGSEAERTGGRLSGLGKAAGVAFAAVGTAALGAAVGAVAFGKSAVNAASDLNETISKTETIFGDSSKEIIAWSETAAKSMGLSKNEALTAASGFQNMFSQIGIGADEGKNMSKSIVQISSDLASFHNVAGGAAEVTDLISAAMRGEYDSIQKLVPTLNAAAVEQRALADTHKGTAKELTNAEKATATYALIMEGAGAATGDFAKTAGGLANSTRTAGAQFDDIKAKIGQGLLPVVTTLVNLFSTHVLPILEKVGKSLVSLLAPAFAEIAGGIRAMIAAFQNSEDGITSSGVAGVFERIGLVAGQAMPTVIDIFGKLRDVVAAVVPVAVELGKQFLATLVAVVPHVIKFGKSILDSVVPALLKIAKAVREALPPVLSLARDGFQFLAENVLPKVSAVLRVVVPIVATLAEKIILLVGWLTKNRDVLFAILTPIAAYILITKAWAAGTALVSAAQGVWNGVQAAFNAIMMANPIVLVVVAIAALVAAVILAYNRVGWFRDFVDASFDAIVAAFNLIKGAAKAVFDWVSDRWPLLLVILTGPFGLAVVAIVKHWDTVRDAVLAVFNWIKEHWPLLLAILTGPIGLAVLAIVKNWDTIKEGATKVYEWVRDKFQAIYDFIAGLVRGIGNVASDFVDAITGPLNTLIRAWNRLKFTIPRVEIDLPGPLGSIGAGPWTVDLPHIDTLMHGGIVARSGLALVHAGEQFSGVGRTFGNSTVINVNVATTGLGADAPSIQRAVVHALQRHAIRNGPLDIPIRSAS